MQVIWVVAITAKLQKDYFCTEDWRPNVSGERQVSHGRYSKSVRISQENLSRGLQDEKCNRFVQNLWSAPSKGHRACVVSNSAGPDSSQSRSKVSRKLLGAKQHSQLQGRININGERGGLEGLKYYCTGRFGKLL